MLNALRRSSGTQTPASQIWESHLHNYSTKSVHLACAASVCHKHAHASPGILLRSIR